MTHVTGSAGFGDVASAGFAAAPSQGARLMALLIFTQLPNVLAYTVTIPLLAEMAKEFAHDPASAYLVKLISGILGPAMAFGALAAGLFANRFDRRWVLMALGAIYAASAVAPALLNDLELIVTARFVTGFAAAAAMATGLAIVGDYLPEHRRAPTIGILTALNMVVSLLSLPLAGFVGDMGWRYSFLIYLAALPLVLLASLSSLPTPTKSEPDGGEVATGSRWFSNLPLGLFFLALCVGVIVTVPGIYVSFHLGSVGLGKASTVGLLMMMNSLVAAGFSTLFGRMWARSPRLVFCLGFGSMAAGLAVLARADGYLLVIPALLLMGVGIGLLSPSVMSWVVDTVDKRRRGQIVGAIQGTLSIASLVALTGLEPLVPRFGTGGVLFAVGVLSGALCLFFLVRRRPTSDSRFN